MALHPGLLLLKASFALLYALIGGLLLALWRPEWRTSRWWKRGLGLIAVAFFAALWLRTAWVTEDAYIIFRSLEQVMAGRGPVWNPNERVQAFTSPLWFLLLLSLRWFSSDVYLNAILLHTVMSAWLLWMWKQRLSPWAFGLVVLIAMAAAGFVDFLTSGLENSLGYALLTLWALKGLEGLTGDGWPARRVLALAGLSALIILTRQDYSLLVLPALLWSLMHYARRKGWRALAQPVSVFATPLLLWHAFSLIFYGSLFPNTYYAKLNIGIPRSILLVQGFRYYYGMTLMLDPWLLIVPALVAMWLARKPGFARWMALGMAGYALYVGWIGGDFMLGRFFTPLYGLALAGLAAEPRFRRLGLGSSLWERRIVAGLIVVLGASIIFLPIRPLSSVYTVHRSSSVAPCGIANERNVYYAYLGLLPYIKARLQQRPFPRHPWAREGRSIARSSDPYFIQWAVGMVGYFSGTEKIIIDPNALPDPFLARLPAENTRKRVGHYERQVPAGYPESHISGHPQMDDPELNTLLTHVFRATRGPFWDPKRWESIVYLENGAYKELLVHLAWPANLGPPPWHEDANVAQCASELALIFKVDSYVWP